MKLIRLPAHMGSIAVIEPKAIGPEDVVVVKLEQRIPAERIAKITERLHAIFGITQRVLVLDGGVSLELYRKL